MEYQTITIDGKKYREIQKNEKIGTDAFKSFDGGELRPVCHPDTMKMKPNDFYCQWKFYRMMKE